MSDFLRSKRSRRSWTSQPNASKVGVFLRGEVERAFGRRAPGPDADALKAELAASRAAAAELRRELRDAK
jgi:hypothetical protein